MQNSNFTTGLDRLSVFELVWGFSVTLYTSDIVSHVGGDMRHASKYCTARVIRKHTEPIGRCTS